ncbi:MAG: DotA/TraY family protein [Micavibrio sp.]
MQEIRAKQVLGYVFLPGLLPRAKTLFGTGFGFLAFLMANILQSTRLLPDTHPYLNPANIGRYSIRSVFAQAGSNLIFDRKHLDQIAIYFTLMLGFILLVLQFVFLAVGLISKPVLAGGPPFIGMFSTPFPERDIAFTLLDKVFGVPDFFNSEYAPTAGPLPFHEALHELFRFYSTALLLVAVIIFLYYVLVIVAETAQTGTPFGRRFNHLWAPIRLVVALGLLIPINYGLNSGQYIVLMAAKMGSGFATNGWYLFNTSLTNGLGVEDHSLFARAKAPDVWSLVKFMNLVTACKVSYERLGVTDIEAYIVKNPVLSQTVGVGDYANALAFYNNGDIVVRFGKKDTVEFADELGAVKPYCGEILFHTIAATNTGALIGPYQVQESYFQETMRLWDDFAISFGIIMAYRVLPKPNGGCTLTSTSYFPASACDDGIQVEHIARMRTEEQKLGYEAGIASARNAMIASGNFAIPQDLLDRGWAGAGIWYNRIAEMNGAFIGAVSYVPSPTLLPMPMQMVLEENKKANQNVTIESMLTPNLSDGRKVPIEGIDKLVLDVLYQSYQKLGTDDAVLSSETTTKKNVFRDTINLLLGLNGLYSMRENTDIHPLAQLVALGKGIVDSSIRNLFAATLFAAGGGAFRAMDMGAVAAVAGVGTGIFTTLTTIGLTVGFVLYYVLPFLPFIYFFFAVGAWLKTVFEAMVGAPLWALAHLRIDGAGLPGESAMGGYFMILEIFIRPILTVFGLIGSLIIFSALVKVLNEIFTLVTANLAGFDNNPCELTAPGGACTLPDTNTNNTMADPTNPVMTALLQFKRDTVDEFFFTIIYTVIVYMMATSSFKMIDQVPQQILRWMGAGVQVFADQIKDATEGLTRTVAQGGFLMTQNLQSGLVQSAGQFGRGIGQMVGGGRNSSNVTGTGNRPPPTGSPNNQTPG